MKVKELTMEQLRALIEEMIEAKLEEYLGDPDQGLEIREEVKARFRVSLAVVERGEKGTPIEQVVKKLGLEWK